MYARGESDGENRLRAGKNEFIALKRVCLEAP